ncbi:mucin-2 isoform X2 [Danio aesculapii]|uniref:mucin-2 isoform X2 n=1 Tax=Danio aesculapii TaxID=1142201 RepID=UPI0024C05359|nr:mucin-2 isoform X2 [Danio aesculapii]
MNVLEASGDPEGEATDDLTGRKKSRLKSLKSRLLVKIKRKEDDGGLKQSQSESDIAWGAEDSDCSKGMLGSRAFSHDSIFQAEHSHPDTEPLRVLSQENIHGKIRALQMKLQQQKMHLGPPPLLLPGKHREDAGRNSEDDGLPRSPPEVSHSDVLYMSISNKASSQPLSPQSISPTPLSPQAPGSKVDFSTPPQVVSLLDNSAARHRMSLKPKNQRASAKNKRLTTTDTSRTRSESLNNLDQSVATRQEEEGVALVKEIPRARSYSSQVLRPGEKLTAMPAKSLLISPLMSLLTAEDARQISSEPELVSKILSTSPTRSPSPKDMSPAEPLVEKPPIPVVPIDRKGKEESETFSSSKLLKSNQSNPVSTVRPAVSTTPELNPVKDEKKTNTVPVQNQLDILSKYSVQSPVNIESSTYAPPNVICGVNLRPSSFRRYVPSTDDKPEFKTLPPVIPVSAVSQDATQTETIKRQRTVSGSFSVSSDKNQERQRTGSFTGVVGQDGLKKEATEANKPTLKFKTDWQVGSQVEKAIKDPCVNLPQSSKKEDKGYSDSVIPPKSMDLSKPQNVEEIQIYEKQEIRVEATEQGLHEVEAAKEADENVVEDAMAGKVKESTNAFGVKLRSTSLSLKFRLDKAQSEDKAKRYSFETFPEAPSVTSQSDSTSCAESEAQRIGTGAIRVHAKHKDPTLQTNGSTILVQASSSFSRDKERAGFLKPTEPPQPSTSDTKIVPSPPKEGTDLPPVETPAVSSQETIPTSTASEVSWMDMAREKTRSLQQLFTSRLPEFPSLQSRPTTSSTTQTQSSPSQANPKTTQNITSQPTATQPQPKPTETKQPPFAQHCGRSTQSNTQFTPVQTQTRTSQPSASSTTTQPLIDSTKDVQFQSKAQGCNSTVKPTQCSVTSTSNVHASKQPTQTPPIQQSSPFRAASQTPSQAIQHPTTPPGPPHLFSSPKVTSHLDSQHSASTVLKKKPLNEEGEPTVISGKADRASVLQGKGSEPEDGRPVWATGLGNKSSLVQRWENPTTTATKNIDQKSSSESRSTAVSDRPLRSSFSKVSGTGPDSSLSSQASVSSIPVRSAEREEKGQQKSPSSSPSSSPLQSARDSGQPSWMELAKRKSLAWSDMTMD